jgi:hypothetical protein
MAIQNHNSKEQLQYFKEQDKKIHKTRKTMVNILSNLNIAMCHVFIQDKINMAHGGEV